MDFFNSIVAIIGDNFLSVLFAAFNTTVAYSVFVMGFKLRGPKAGAKLLSLKENGRENLAKIEYSIKPGSVQCLLSRIKCERYKKYPNKTIPSFDFEPDFLEKDCFTISVSKEKTKVELELSFSKWFHDLSLPIDLSHEHADEIEQSTSHGQQKSSDPEYCKGSNDVIVQAASEKNH
ncbi:hypothetical protein [Parasutterella sp.]|uniref:hypothetical protein n=1 Tax=Parasutterella sp. TaxID=2049037 RepID=UPI003AB4D625